MNPTDTLSVQFAQGAGAHGIDERVVGVLNFVEIFLHAHGDFQIFGVVRGAEESQIVKHFLAKD